MIFDNKDCREFIFVWFFFQIGKRQNYCNISQVLFGFSFCVFFWYDWLFFKVCMFGYFHIPFLKNWFYIYYSLGFSSFCIHMACSSCIFPPKFPQNSRIAATVRSYDCYINETYTKNYKTVIVNYFTFRSYKKLKSWYPSLISCRTVTTPPSSRFMTIIVLQVISF